MKNKEKDGLIPDFEISANRPVSNAFREKNLFTFSEAANFVMHLPYRRNKDKDKLMSVLTDGCGTCSTKHALLKQLADENGFENLKLILGIFKMHAGNTPEVASILKTHQLDHIPEAHNYLRYDGALLDFTKPDFKLAADEKDLLLETELRPEQVNTYKIAFHRNFLKNWIDTNERTKLSFEELWDIREICISLLAGNKPGL